MHCSELDTCIEARCTVRNLTHDAGARARGGAGRVGVDHEKVETPETTTASLDARIARSVSGPARRQARESGRVLRASRPGQVARVERLSKSREAVQKWRGCCVEGPLHCIVHLQRRNSSGSCAARGGREPRRPRASSGGVRRAARGGGGSPRPRRLTLEPFSGALRCRFQVQERTIEGAPGWPTAKRRREVRAVGPRTRADAHA